MKQGVFVQRIRLGRRLIKAEIDSRKGLELLLDTAGKLLLPDTDKAQAAAELFAGLLGAEKAQQLLDFYGERKEAEKQIPLLLCRILKRSARAEMKRQKREAKKYVKGI